MACVFCRIVGGELDSWRVYEDEECIAFLDAYPASLGHTLVVPKEHAEDLLTLSEAQSQAVMRATWRVAHLLKNCLAPAGLNLVQSSGAAAWQDVFHMHMHVIPRYVEDDLRRPWDGGSAIDRDQAAAIQQHLTGG